MKQSITSWQKAENMSIRDITLMVVALCLTHATPALDEERSGLVRAIETIRESMITGAPDSTFEERREKARLAIDGHRDVDPQTVRHGGAALSYWKARLHLVAGDRARYRRDVVVLLERRSVAVEAWAGLHEREGAPPPPHYRAHALLAPLSLNSSYANDFLSDKPAEPRPVDAPVKISTGRLPAPPIPRASSFMTDVAEMATRSLSTALARDAWLEVLYAQTPPYSYLHISDTWLGERHADIWLKVAELDRLAGSVDTPFDYAAKAMIYGTDEHFRRGAELVERWIREGDPVPAPVPEPNADDLVQIARLYGRLHAHPRGFAILDQYAEVIGVERASELRKALMAEWLELLEEFAKGREEYAQVFGQPIATIQQRQSVVIPPVLDPAVLAELARELEQSE